MSDISTPKLILIDGNSLLYRSYFGVRAFSTTDGIPTNAVFGLAQMLIRILEMKPEYIAVAFDTPKPTFRHIEFPDYKGHRKAIPEDLIPQTYLARDLIRGFNIPVIECEGFEADDIIGTLSVAATDQGLDTLIVTGDLDSLQLVNEQTSVMTTVKGVTDTVIYDVEAVENRFGIGPEKMADYKGLKGDPSDNIPGVPGIGDKTAVDLIKRFGSIEHMLEHLEELPEGKVRKTLTENKEIAVLSKRLATIILDVPVGLEMDAYRSCDPDYTALRDLFVKLEFRNLLRRLPEPAISEPRITPGTMQSVCTQISEASEADKLLQNIRKSGTMAFSLLTSEGNGRECTMTGINISLSPGECYTLGCQDDKPKLAQPGFDFGDEEKPKSCFIGVSPALSDPSISKICHNSKNAYNILSRCGTDLKNIVFDTMTAAYVLDPTRGTFSLEEIASAYMHIHLQPGQELEADAVLRLRVALEDRLARDGMLDLYNNIELPLSRLLFDMERLGVLVDYEQLGVLSEKLGREITDVENRVYEAAGSQFNIGSPKQLQVILFDQLGLKSSKKTKTGFSTGAAVLEEMAEEYPIVADILKYRELSKIKSTYADALPLLVDPASGRIHTTLNQTVAATGRLSSSEPNLQNIPIRTELGREIRRAFISEPGCALVSADYSQIELRVMAHFAEDSAMITAFENGEDIHKATACTLFGCDASGVTSEMRRRAKTINFAVIYGMADFTLGKELGITVKEAKSYIEEYFRKFPGVLEYTKQTIESCKETGYVKTLLGRRRYVPDVNNSNYNIRSAAERAAVNSPIQGTAADIMKIAMLRVDRALKESNLKSKLLLQVHDELLVESPFDEVEAISNLLKEEMEHAFDLKAPLKADIKTGPNWAEMKG